MEDLNHSQEAPRIHILQLSSDQHALLYDAMQDADETAATANRIKRSIFSDQQLYVDKTNRLAEFTSDLQEDYNDQSATVTVGALYLQMHETIRASHRATTYEDINELFKSNMTLHFEIAQYYDRTGSSPNQKLLRKLMLKHFHRPTWFQGNTNEWLNYVGNILMIPRKLNSREKADKQSEITYEKYTSYIPEEHMPQWYGHMHMLTEESLLDEVKVELHEDEQVQLSILKSLQLVQERIISLQQYFATKNEGGNEWLGLHEEYALEKACMNLHSLLLYINPLLELYRDPNIEDQATHTYETLQFIFSTFLEANPLDPDIIALWMENCSKLDMLADKQVFSTILRESDDEDAFSKLWIPLRDHDKKQYRFLRYSFGTLIESLPSEEKEELADFVDAHSMNDALAALARKINAFSPNPDEMEANSNLKKVLSSISKFGMNWFAENHAEIREQLVQILQRPEDFFNERINDEIIEINVNDVETPFFDWTVQFTANILNPTGGNNYYLIATTPEELTTRLDNALQKEHIGISVKTSSIINCLEHIISTPEHIENLTPHLGVQYSEIDWKKRKRGKVRILYQIDHETKQLRFGLHQKKADGYRF